MNAMTASPVSRGHDGWVLYICSYNIFLYYGGEDNSHKSHFIYMYIKKELLSIIIHFYFFKISPQETIWEFFIIFSLKKKKIEDKLEFLLVNWSIISSTGTSYQQKLGGSFFFLVGFKFHSQNKILVAGYINILGGSLMNIPRRVSHY